MKKESNDDKSSLMVILNEITLSLEKNGNKAKVASMEKYLKNKVKCYGNSHPQIYSIYKTLKQSPSYKALSQVKKFDLSLLLLQQSYFDHKLISTCILADSVKSITKPQIERLKETIEEGTVNNWAISDAIASKFCKIYSLLSKANTLFIAEWKKENNMWLKRMSCVAFINRIKHKDSKPNFKGFIDLMFSICEETILSKQRFNQLGTGWLLRELAVVNYERYYTFFINHYNNFTREATRYSIEKLTQKQQKDILCYHPPEE